jgi:hypothetical protein
VTRPSDRDAALERVLRRLPSQEPDDELNADECLDAETIAAMAEGTLLPHPRALAAAHASACARCQAVLAAVIRTAPPAASKRAWWRARSAMWLAPLAGVGVAVALWVAVDERGAPSATAPAPQSDQAYEPRRPQLASEQTAPEFAPPASRDGVDTLSRARRELKPSTSVPAQPAVTGQAAAAPPSGAAVGEPDAFSAAPVPEPVAALQEPPPPAPPASPPFPTPRPVANSAPAASRADATALVETGRVFDAAGGVSRVAAKASSPRTEVTSPDPRSRWRIGGILVERSTDGGVTWTPQLTGTDVPLIAGSSPQPNVCWLAGAGGTVIISVDGLSWQRLLPPAAGSILSIAASSADAAVVTTSDGRSYATADRGRTWSPRR